MLHQIAVRLLNRLALVVNKLNYRGSLMSEGSRLSMPTTENPTLGPLLKSQLHHNFTINDIVNADLIAKNRPSSIREFDQIPMVSQDLLFQVKLVAPMFANKTVVFMGDHDSTSVLLGLLSMTNDEYMPKKLFVLDFDERLLERLIKLARNSGFGDIFDVRKYNVFDPLESDLVGQFDWFYTNPPYGRYNNGRSALLFITRGCELVKRVEGQGCAILPDDRARPWTNTAMHTVQSTLVKHGWYVADKMREFHSYYLDDDKELSSSVLIVNQAESELSSMPYSGRLVSFAEIPFFYGRNVTPPYPRYISAKGKYEYDWI